MDPASLLDLHVTDRADRVREHTGTAVQVELDEELVARLRHYAERRKEQDWAAAVTARIVELEQEPDVERTLEANASVLALTGTVLAALHDRRWLVVPTIVTAFLLQHALQGWCPPIGLFRRIGIRTRSEVDAERYALKLLRGDLDVDMSGNDTDALVRRMIEAVTR